MVAMFIVTVVSSCMPSVPPVLPIFAFAGMDVIIFRARHVHRLLFNPHLGRFFFDRHLHTVYDGAAALHVLRVVAWLRRDTFADHGARYCANGGRRSAAISMSDLVAEQAAGNASDDCATSVVTAFWHLNLFVPALLARTFNCLIFGCKGRCWQGEG